MLIKNFPELSSVYHDEIGWQEGNNTGCHIVYGDVFEPFIEKMVTGKKCAELQRTFDFIESLLAYKELYVEEVILFSILEKLNDNQQQINYCRPFMSNLTLLFLDKL